MNKTSLNNFHVAGGLFFLLATTVGIFISGSSSPVLQAKGWYIFHAYIAFMGFGTIMIFGHQLSIVPALRAEAGNPISAGISPGKIIPVIVPTLALVWAMYLMEGLTGNVIFYYIAVVLGFAVLGCLAWFAVQLYSGIRLKTLLENLPLRFFATSIFMCFLAYGQMVHVTINEIKPVLPFSETIFLKTNYLAFSFPISLTIMGGMYTPFHDALKSGKIRHRWMWESQYIMLVVGVFSLFFALIFDNKSQHDIFAQLQLWFSALLVASILVFAVVMMINRRKVSSLPGSVWRYYACAMGYLGLAGLAGLMLGYGWNKDNPFYYFFIQAHVHLALLGWVGFGIPGVFFYIIELSGGRAGDKRGNLQFYLMNAGVCVMVTGIYFKSLIIRGSGGALIFVSFLFLIHKAIEGVRSRSSLTSDQ